MPHWDSLLLKVSRSYFSLLLDLFTSSRAYVGQTVWVATSYLGNMTHPVVTRLGVNQFWYKHWFSDTMHTASLHQDKLLTKLVYLYLNYGLTTKSNPFVHEYWYKASFSKLRVGNVTDYTRCFRRFFYTNDTLGIEHSYLIRNRTPEYFPLKLWLFRYAGWFIISIKWFKPIKTKSRNRRKGGASYVTSINRGFKSGHLSRRIKILTSLLKVEYLSTNQNYYF